MDRALYKTHMQQVIHTYPNLSTLEGAVEDLVISESVDNQSARTCKGVILGERRS